MSVDFEQVYLNHAEPYDRMVSAEDCDGNLLPALLRIAPIGGARIVEVGVGTGRLTRMLVSAGAARIVGIDQAEAMLQVARRRMSEVQGAGAAHQVILQQAECAALPVENASCDLAIAGWTWGHTTQWEPGAWQARIGRFADEFDRVTRSGGTEIIVETLGTGTQRPGAPNESLAAYYRWLESDRGFRREVVSTDYAFPSPEDAAQACGFFFGESFAELILLNRWTRVPEWTGIWWRRKP